MQAILLANGTGRAGARSAVAWLRAVAAVREHEGCDMIGWVYRGIAALGRPAARIAGLLVLLTAAPLPSLAQDEGYRLRAGDILRIEVVEDAGLSRQALIAPDGRVTLPLAGSVQASGRTIEAVQADLIARLTPSFAAPPTVFVSIDRLADRPAGGGGGGGGARAGIDIFVLGEAGKTGLVPMKPGSTLLQGLAQIGGFTKFAAKRRIQLRRGERTWTVDYAAIENGTSNAGDIVLQDDDVIVVPQRKLFE
jgi:polysaccharide export outer membrane protein